ncbi:CDP-alcohol phosphatidyltransferase family protein [Arthrobacter sp. H14-L1]|uniref:CDP-alcohol phosphatidyltransferase family protein n=1 Tax=Arthrobacter sp. H14-L1 TaxID=2996697 RepID=UPI00226DFCD3|nr:CDP-alcohol phosphatidyltransferase family protein [Arthrobacter sp. H14-L1]MCY0904969.1 CDP-alcohol phosphatidyltransferase family protein [Arthrobacter sp. H14-L1]
MSALDATSGRAARRTEAYRETLGRLASAQKKAGLHAPAYSRFINRKLGRLLAAWAYRAGFTPNTVTLISAAFTYIGIILLAVYPPSWALGFAVALFLVVGYAFDSADGQLARLRGGGSPAGEWLDHMADAIKISALPIFLAVGMYRFESVAQIWLLVPLAATIVGAALFFGMILTEQLRRQLGTSTPAADAAGGRSSWVRSVLVIPMDYGVLCLSFILLGALPAFLVLYTLITIATAGFFILASLKWFRELRTVGTDQISSRRGGGR